MIAKIRGSDFSRPRGQARAGPSLSTGSGRIRSRMQLWRSEDDLPTTGDHSEPRRRLPRSRFSNDSRSNSSAKSTRPARPGIPGRPVSPVREPRVGQRLRDDFERARPLQRGRVGRSRRDGGQLLRHDDLFRHEGWRHLHGDLDQLGADHRVSDGHRVDQFQQRVHDHRPGHTERQGLLFVHRERVAPLPGQHGLDRRDRVHGVRNQLQLLDSLGPLDHQ